MTRKNLYPGWRTMTAAQRHNAKMDRIFDEWRRLEREKSDYERAVARFGRNPSDINSQQPLSDPVSLSDTP